MKKKILAGLLAVVLLIIGAVTGVLYYQHENTYHQYESLVGSYTTDSNTYARLLEKHKDALTISDDQVKDPATVHKLAKDASYKVVKLTTVDKSASTDTLTRANQTNQKHVDALKAILSVFEKDVKAVVDSKNQKDVENATSALTARISEGNGKLAESEGKVADENTRTSLQNALTDGQKLVDAKSTDIADMNAKAQAISDAMNGVQASMDAKTQADEQARAQAEAQARAAAQAQAQARQKSANRAARSGNSGIRSNSGNTRTATPSPRAQNSTNSSTNASAVDWDAWFKQKAEESKARGEFCPPQACY